MDRCSYFIKDKALFGSYPMCQEDVDILETNGVRYFVDLTCPTESKIIPYKTNHTYIHYPISDHKTPSQWTSFAKLILKIVQIIKELKEGEKIYIHCKGGHGRSGTVVACVLCYIFRLKPENALELTNEYHNERQTMRQKWRDIGSPQTLYQKNFVIKFFSPICFTNDPKNFFSTYSNHTVTIEGMGTFHTAEAAYQAHKDKDNKEYVNLQLSLHSAKVSKIIGKSCDLCPDWEEKKVSVMYHILKLKFDQHSDIREILIHTGLRPFVYFGKTTSFWNNTGKNMLGKLLAKIRSEYYI